MHEAKSFKWCASLRTNRFQSEAEAEETNNNDNKIHIWSLFINVIREFIDKTLNVRIQCMHLNM